MTDRTKSDCKCIVGHRFGVSCCVIALAIGTTSSNGCGKSNTFSPKGSVTSQSPTSQPKLADQVLESVENTTSEPPATSRLMTDTALQATANAPPEGTQAAPSSLTAPSAAAPRRRNGKDRIQGLGQFGGGYGGGGAEGGGGGGGEGAGGVSINPKIKTKQDSSGNLEQRRKKATSKAPPKGSFSSE